VALACCIDNRAASKVVLVKQREGVFACYQGTQPCTHQATAANSEVDLTFLPTAGSLRVEANHGCRNGSYQLPVTGPELSMGQSVTHQEVGTSKPLPTAVPVSA